MSRPIPANPPFKAFVGNLPFDTIQSDLDHIFSGMKVATVLAVAGAVVGEFIASEEGLGYLMQQVQVTLDTAAMFMAVLVITLIGVILVWVAGFLLYGVAVSG